MSVKLRTIEYLLLAGVVILFALLANNYIIRRVDVARYKEAAVETYEKLKPQEKVVCGDSQITLAVAGGELCRDNVSASTPEEQLYLHIFDTYQKSGDGKEIIYDFLDEGDVSIADRYLNNEIAIDRYEPVQIDNLTWDEDPYGERYWRFIFYSLRGTRHLLYAYRSTGDERYRDKLISIMDSFASDGINNQSAWEDYHAVAFRAMVLTNTWWKLREENGLTAEISSKLLQAIKKHGDFLLDEKHYQKNYNHGLNQASALLLLGINFPDLDTDVKWLTTAEARINNGIDTLIDNDGVLIENSPYYHFYVLEKYWQMKQYLSHHALPISDAYLQKLDLMIAYATYIVQPNLRVPMLGASLEWSVGNSGGFREIGKENPEFLYVLTQGKEGKEPKDLNKYYPVSGQVIMRSGWGHKAKFENSFAKQTQVIFDVGDYRTEHSDMDALSFNLYSNGKTLITDTGLYTYETDDPLKSFFHGTRGHNTVVVDGQDQRQGAPLPGTFKEGDGFTSYVAQHDLYPGTFHQRSMMLIGHDLVVIVDRLISDQEHDYEQLFHLAPGLMGTADGTTVTVKNEARQMELTIRQLASEGIETHLGDMANDPNHNVCSYEYEKTVSCQTVTYKTHARNATFITLLEIGDASGPVSAHLNGTDRITISEGGSVYEMALSAADDSYFEQLKAPKPAIADIASVDSVDLVRDGSGWKLEGGEEKALSLAQTEDGNIVLIPHDAAGARPYAVQPRYEADIDGLGHYDSIGQTLPLDLPTDPTQKTVKIYEQEDLLPIFGYHNVIPDNQEIKSPTLEIHRSAFDQQLDYLTNTLGCRWFTFGDIMQQYVLKNEKVPKRACVMTFDDGHENNFSNAYPIYKKYGAVATLYIIAGSVLSGNSTYTMQPSRLDELQRNGNEIGSHTVSHPISLTEGFDEKGLLYEIEESKKMLEQQGYDITTFAYPRGNQNEQVVDLVSKYYLAGRDTSKDGSWRDPRANTISMDESYIWHMNYHKPELETPDELGKKMGYNTFWQFEEGFKVDKDLDGDIKTISGLKPTITSYAVVALPDIGDMISNKFIVGQDGHYTIQAFVMINVFDDHKSTVKLYIDGTPVKFQLDMEESECNIYKKQYWCYYAAKAELAKGVHTLSVQAAYPNARIDKFKMYRELAVKDRYTVNISEISKVMNVPPEAYPKELTVDLEKKGWFGFGKR